MEKAPLHLPVYCPVQLLDDSQRMQDLRNSLRTDALKFALIFVIALDNRFILFQASLGTDSNFLAMPHPMVVENWFILEATALGSNMTFRLVLEMFFPLPKTEFSEGHSSFGSWADSIKFL